MALFDFLKPQWKHSNPELRATALRLLEEDRQEIFLAAALEDPDPALRVMGAKRLSREDSLRQALSKSQDIGVQEILRKALLKLIAEKAKTAEVNTSAQEAKAWIEEIKADTKTLEDVARGAQAHEVRRAILPYLAHATSLLTIALEEETTDIALAALSRLTREQHLQSVAKTARNKEVRALAKQKLKAIEDSKKPDVLAVNRAKLQLLLAVAEKAEAGSAELNPAFDWASTLEQIEGAEHALNEFLESGAAPTDGQVTNFRQRTAAFRTRHARHQTTEIDRAKRDGEEQNNLKIQTEICLRMEALYAEPGAVDAGEVESLTSRFQSTGPSPDNEAMRSRFRIARERVTKDKLRKQREEEDAVRRKNDAESRKTRLEELLMRAETLRDSGATNMDPVVLASKIADLRKGWQQATSDSAAIPGEQELQSRFNEALSVLEGLVSEARKKAAVKLEGWIKELDTLAESANLQAAEKRFKEIQGKWKSQFFLAPADAAEKLTERYHEAANRIREVFDWARWSNLQRKLDICAQIETLAQLDKGEDKEDREERKVMVARFKELLAEWKTIGPVPWENTETTWDRYHQACDVVYEKCREYFAELDEERESNYKVKEELCAKLEGLLAVAEPDWREATEAFKEAQSNWKALGAVPREKSEELWTRFRVACQSFYARKDKNSAEHLARKLELAALAESLKDSTQWKNTAAQIKDAQETWKTIGPVPRDQAEAVWKRFHNACEHFFKARREYFDKLETERPLNLEKKLALCEAMENLAELPGDQERYQRILDAQTEWKNIGPVPREHENAIWERFRKPIDTYFQEHKQRQQEERGTREEFAKIKEDLCTEAESLRDSTDWKSTIERIKTLQIRWKTTGQTFREQDQQLWKRFRTACDGFFDRLKEFSSQRDQERGDNLRKKIDICFTIEILAGLPPSDEDAKETRENWKEAQRGAGATVPEPMDDWNKATDRVKHFQLEWKKIGPVPREDNDAIWDRFQRACDVFFEERRRDQGHPADDPQANLESKLALIADAEELAHTPGSQNEDPISKLFQQWKRIGPVPRAQSDYVWERFSSACDTAVGRISGRA